MAKLTKKWICECAAKAHGLNPSVVELERVGGTWYWAGDVSAALESTEVARINLNDWRLDQWLANFSKHVRKWQIKEWGRTELHEQTLMQAINKMKKRG